MAKSKVREILKSNDTPKEKFDYLWGYYRWHVIIATLGLLLFGFMTYDFINRPVPYFHVSVLSPEIDPDEEEALAIELEELLQPEGKNESIFVTFTPYGQLAERFVAQLSAAEYDLILMDEQSYRQYADFGTMQEFDILELSEEDLHRTDIYDNTMAMETNQIPLFTEFDTTSDLYLMIPSNAQRKETIVDFFETQGYTIELIDS